MLGGNTQNFVKEILFAYNYIFQMKNTGLQKVKHIIQRNKLFNDRGRDVNSGRHRSKVYTFPP